MIKPLSFFICAVLALAVSINVQARPRDPLSVELPQLEAIPGAEWFWVAQRMARNNVPMTIKMFNYRGDAEEVQKYYVGLWKTKGHGKSRTKIIGDLIILSTDIDGYVYSAQFSQKGDYVKGKLVVSPTPLNAKYEKKSELPIPPRSSIENKIESLDGARRSETLNIESRLRVPQIVDFYSIEMDRQGWKQYASSGNGRDSAVVSFQRGGELLQLTVTGLQGRNSKFSEVLIHWIK